MYFWQLVLHSKMHILLYIWWIIGLQVILQPVASLARSNPHDGLAHVHGVRSNHFRCLWHLQWQASQRASFKAWKINEGVIKQEIFVWTRSYPNQMRVSQVFPKSPMLKCLTYKRSWVCKDDTCVDNVVWSRGHCSTSDELYLCWEKLLTTPSPCDQFCATSFTDFVQSQSMACVSFSQRRSQLRRS